MGPVLVIRRLENRMNSHDATSLRYRERECNHVLRFLSPSSRLHPAARTLDRPIVRPPERPARAVPAVPLGQGTTVVVRRRYDIQHFQPGPSVHEQRRFSLDGRIPEGPALPLADGLAIVPEHPGITGADLKDGYLDQVLYRRLQVTCPWRTVAIIPM